MQDFDFTKHEYSKLMIAQEEIKGLFVLMLGLDGKLDLWFQSKQKFRIVSHKWKCKLK